MSQENKFLINIPQGAEKILERLNAAGHEAYIVGGCVRDSLLGITPKDWDITTSADPGEVKKLFRRTVDTGIRHGTVTVLMGKESYEVTTYRVDGNYSDGRHPDRVSFTGDLTEDLKRRDFTINAMSYHPDQGIIDEFDGAGDISRRLVKCVGDPLERFTEDALRMMRAVRFAAQLGFDIDGATAEAARQLADRIEYVSAERIREELVKTLVSPDPARIMTAMDLGLTARILPEFDRSYERAMEKGEAFLPPLELGFAPANAVLRLAVLMRNFGESPAESASAADDILKRLKSDNHTREHVVRLIRLQGHEIEESEAGVRRAAYIAGTDILDELISLQKSAAAAAGNETETLRLDSIGEIYRKVTEEGQCVNLKGLALNGNDLISSGIGPGPVTGEILKELLEEIIEDPSLNRKELLLEKALKNAESKRIIGK
ncbi:MAG: CCA tRNA nucleotidyltransferase [Lachnospiraceae bacterium]|nr:CCA tRNA nucleotidyltransferase [Lachnospiraceae bacterium]